MDQKPYIIAVDGPAGVGKSTVCNDVAKALGILHLDTGATYRTLALGLLRLGVEPTDAAAVEAALPQIHVDLKFEAGRQRMLLDGEDVTDSIRTNPVSAASSACAVIPAVRHKMVELQREKAKSISMIVDGRDIGTCVFPDTQFKFYLTADVAERAKRRYLELQEKGTPVDLAQLEREIAFRDQTDSTREMSPLRQAEDATLIDTTHMTQAEVAETMLEYISKIMEERP